VARTTRAERRMGDASLHFHTLALDGVYMRDESGALLLA
jgi:hypothetical protein